MLKQANKHKGWFSKQHPLCGDMQQLPFANDSVDFIFANLALHWGADTLAILQEWQRVLKPEGLLMFSTYGPDTLKQWRQALSHRNIPAFADMHDIGDHLVQTGFSDPVMDVEHLQLNYANLERMIEELYQLGVLDFIGIETKQEAMQLYHEYAKNQEKIYPLSYEIVYGHAWGTPTRQQRVSASGEVSIPLANLRGIQ
jgi:malonyl-CoA O-methyltransferase